MSSRPFALVLLSAVLVSVGPSAVAADPVGCGGEEATIVGTDGDDALTGTDGDDVVWLGDGDDTFEALGGNDRVCGGPGADTLDGGEGRDSLDGAGDPGVIVTVPRPVGPAAEDDGADDRLVGGAGNDLLSLGEGADDALGEDGRDYASFGPAAVVDARSGTTSQGGVFSGIETYVVAAVFWGADVAESVFGGTELHLGGGDDHGSVRAPEAWIDAGEGADWVTTESGTVLGGPGDDTVDLHFKGVVRGGAGNDTVRAQKPRENDLRGGTGRDDIELHVHHPMVIDLAAGTIDYTVAGVEGSIAGFEVVEAGEGDDLVRGSRRGELLRGYEGEDLINGRGGHDVCRAEETVHCEE